MATVAPTGDGTTLIDVLHRANQVVNQRFASNIGESGPTPRQLAVLASVAASDGLSQTEISDATGIDRATTAEIVGRLTRLGLIKRRRTRHDARTYAVSLTEAGQTVFAGARATSARIESELLALLPPGDRVTLLALLNRLTAAGATTKA
ncbi:MAG: MarR family winged helix-turn-helix transcriptional regulator [Hyphomicrobiaceae bacterium]